MIDDFPAGHVEVDLVIGDLLPGRTLRVKAIGVDDFALRVLYEVAPPIELVHPLDRNDYTWLLFGRDDLGNRYEDGGGAYGLARDREVTEGVHSLQPVPAEGASWLELSFSPAADPEPWRHPRHVIRLDLPFPSAEGGS